MATTMNQRQTSPVATGFSTFAGVLMILVGLFQAFEGLAAISNGNFFILGRSYIYSVNIATWGWIHLIVGVVVAIAGFSVFSGRLWARAVGIVLAMVSAIINFFYIPYYPLWSILIIALDIAVMWALAVYSRDETAT